MNTNTKQDRIEKVIAAHGFKDYSIKQLANYANVSTKTFRTRVSKMVATGRLNYSNVSSRLALKVYVAFKVA